ncbi:MAG: thermonuclease family protein [Candidatus Omnitrophica bacterium]|nr:thermonuclease family protein [Candidatus Omnitrophota bacterium]
MEKTVLAVKKETPLDSYVRLRERVRRTLAEGRERAVGAAKTELAKSYWRAGRWIDQYLRRTQKEESQRAAYGEETVKRLSKDLDRSPSFLYGALEYARANPIFLPARKLPLSHYRSLISLGDKELERAIEVKALKSGWSRRTLAAKVRELKKRFPKEAKKGSVRNRKSKPVKLVPRRGKLQTYRILEVGGSLHLDLGFSTVHEIPENLAGGFKAGEIVEAKSFSEIMKLSEARPDDLYTYWAVVDKLIDADTLWVWIELGFGVRVRQKLRLRGIDAPELGTKKGEAARKFVEGELKPFPRILIGTTKPDKYDRYLSDIFLTHDSKETGIFLNQLLLDTGHARLKNSVVPEDWED